MRKENKPVAIFFSVLCFIFGMHGVIGGVTLGLILLIWALAT